jgi:hypothetical protein
MGYTNFPFGVTSFGVPTMGTAGIPPTSGSVWFVNSATGVDGNAGSFAQPLKTTQRAITLASPGDVIVWMAGHAETISAAGGLTISKAGLTFWNLGVGAEAATFTLGTATTATILITGANTFIGGAPGALPVFVANIASLATIFAIQAAGVNISALVQDVSSTVGAVTDVITTAAASNLTLNLTHQGFTASTIGVTMVKLVGVVNADIVVNAYGAWSTAVVDFATTACVDVQVSGYFYNYNTAITKNVVDTVGGSTWFVSGYDGIGGVAFQGGSAVTPAGLPSAATFAVPAQNSSANVLERDVIGNKTDAAVYLPSATASIDALLQGVVDLQPKTITKAAILLTTGAALFTVAGGPILIEALFLICAVGGDSTAATVQFEVIPTTGSTQTISAASASVASSAAGASITLAGTALATAALLNANGPNLIANPGTIMAPAGTINIVVGSGPTVTGTWKPYIRYRPLAEGVTVS